MKNTVILLDMYQFIDVYCYPKKRNKFGLKARKSDICLTPNKHVLCVTRKDKSEMFTFVEMDERYVDVALLKHDMGAE